MPKTLIPSDCGAKPVMSRKLINEEIYDLGNQFVKGMDSLTIVDPGRLRVPFGGGGGKTPRKQSWMTVSVPAGFSVEVDRSSEIGHDSVPPTASHSPQYCPPSSVRDPNNRSLSNHQLNLQPSRQDVGVDMPRQSNIKLSLEPLIHTSPGHLLSGRQSSEYQWEIKGWTLSAGYTFFGLSLALCNLISSAYTSRVCVAMSPIPVACLILQALFCMDQTPNHCSYRRSILSPKACCLVVSALLVPTICISWNIYFSVALILFVSISVVYCQKQRGILVWICLLGLCLSLIVATPTHFAKFLDARWGMTVSLFFLGILSFLACVGIGGLELKIRYL